MNRITKYSLLVIIPSAVTFAIGWKIGTLQGAGVSTLMSNSLEAASVVTELELLRENKTNSLLNIKEMELDAKLLSYSIYKEQNQGWIIYPFNTMSEFSLEHALKRAAKYRRNSPDNKHRTNKEEHMKEMYLRVDQLLEQVNE